jgi:hypothetical protein
MSVITAIKDLLQARTPVTRDNVRDTVAHIQYDGITEHISFDANGDNAGAKLFAVYSVEAARPSEWLYVGQENI